MLLCAARLKPAPFQISLVMEAFQRGISKSHQLKAAEALEIFPGQSSGVHGLSKVTGMDDRNTRGVISIGSTDDLERVPKAISGSATLASVRNPIMLDSAQLEAAMPPEVTCAEDVSHLSGKIPDRHG